MTAKPRGCPPGCQADAKCDFAVLAGPKMKVPGSCWFKTLGARPFHRPGDVACCPEGMQCEQEKPPNPPQPTPTVKVKDEHTDYDCCNIFNKTHLPPADWRARYPASAPGIKATGRNDTVPAYNVSTSACVSASARICTT
jgi:hypothetical protein